MKTVILESSVSKSRVMLLNVSYITVIPFYIVTGSMKNRSQAAPSR